MKAKITREQLRDTTPKLVTFDNLDTEQRGFLARITPSGSIIMTFAIPTRRRESHRRLTPQWEAGMASEQAGNDPQMHSAAHQNRSSSFISASHGDAIFADLR